MALWGIDQCVEEASTTAQKLFFFLHKNLNKKFAAHATKTTTYFKYCPRDADKLEPYKVLSNSSQLSS